MTQHPMRRKDRLVSEERAREIIETASYGIFMTADLSCQPYGVAVNHIIEGDYVYFHCATVGRKLDNALANPKVCMTFVAQENVEPENYTTRFESVVIEGTATFLEDPEEKQDILLKICKRYVSDDMEKHIQYMGKKLKATAICAVKIEEISGKVNARPM